jgi:hypothetical protein
MDGFAGGIPGIVDGLKMKLRLTNTQLGTIYPSIQPPRGIESPAESGSTT